MTGIVNQTGSRSGIIGSITSVATSAGVLQTVSYFEGRQYIVSLTETNNTAGNYIVAGSSGTNFEKAITSIGANSKFLVTVSLGSILPHSSGSSYGGSARVLRQIGGGSDGSGTAGGGVGNSTGSDTPQAAFYIGAPDQTYPNARGVGWHYLDSPAQAAGTTITYKLAFMAHSTGTYEIMINHHPGGSSSGSYGFQASTSSSLTIQEIAA